MALSTINKAPGVYIDEFEPGQPIAGVATNIAAFVGDAPQGPIDEPTRITSLDQFRSTFGDLPVEGRYLWYAVRAFFANGGTICYVVRTTGHTPGRLQLQNRGGTNAWRATARLLGPPVPNITIAIAALNRLTAATTSAYKPNGTTTAVPNGRDFTLQANQGRQFRPGDRVRIGNEDLMVVRLSGDVLTTTTNPAPGHVANETVRLSDTASRERVIRLTTTVAPAIVADILIPGAILTFSQTIGGATTTDTRVVASVQAEYLDPATPIITYRVTLRDGLAGTYNLDPGQPAVTAISEEFNVTVATGATPRLYDRLSLDSVHPRYFLDAINDDPVGVVRIEWLDPRPGEALPQRLPVAIAATALAGGANAAISAASFARSILTLERVDEVTLLACPDAVALAGATAVATVQGDMISHCERLGDRFAVLDSRAGLDLAGANSVELQRNTVDSARGYAGFYYPWLETTPASPGEILQVPPSGHVCGVIARSDEKRGVHKAPANELISDALGVARTMSDVEQGLLNERGINCIRVFGSRGRPVLWGARTTSSNTNWRYVSTRRLFIYLEESIQEGIRWGVFEPNNQTLWRKLRRTITDFLMRSFRDGALFGDKPEDAFYVRIDETLNPFSEQQLGRLTIEIGIRPAFPAEFIVVRIGIWAGGSETTET